MDAKLAAFFSFLFEKIHYGVGCWFLGVVGGDPGNRGCSPIIP